MKINKNINTHINSNKITEENTASEHIFYGNETENALKNFPVGFGTTDFEIIFAMLTVKKAAAMSYRKLIHEKEEIYSAIEKACDFLLSYEQTYNEGTPASQITVDGSAIGIPVKTSLQAIFPTDALQGGAGTSTHMNVNEVLANMASIILGRPVHYLDDVNRGQSTNDVYPTAVRIAAIKLLRSLSSECASLQTTLQEKENLYNDTDKLGRTELMDAVPITIGQEFGAYAQAIARDRWRLYKVEERLRQTNIGGTAVGTGNNASHRYAALTVENLRKLTDIGLARAEYPMDLTQNQDVFAEVSGLLKALAVNLMKISNDLRLMNSGPHGGFGEITLANMQKGSTIMPGKVNPVMAEMVQQAAMRVIANDSLITMAASKGEFELNAFMPVIADSLIESLRILKNTVSLFNRKCIQTLSVNDDRCRELLDGSFAFATEYTQRLGYDRVSAEIQKNPDSPSEVKKNLDDISDNL